MELPSDCGRCAAHMLGRGICRAESDGGCESGVSQIQRGRAYGPGAWGYYAPSDVWLHAYTGRRRGCLVDAPEDSLYSYIYEYDGAGQLLRILFPARNVATYCLQNEAGGLYVTYKGYLYAAEAGLAGAVLWENDEAGRKKTLLAVTWMVDDVRVTRMEAEIYRPLCRDRALCDCIAYDANFRCAPPQAPWWFAGKRGCSRIGERRS